MAVTMERKKNLFEKLAPLWAVIMMGLHVGAILYTYFISDSFDALNNYTSFIRYIIWAATVLAALFSFVPDSITAIVRHTMFYLLSGAVFVGVLYWYANNRFSEEDAEARALLALFMSGYTDTDYVQHYVEYAIYSTLGLSAAVAAFCAVKYHLSSTSWIKKHIR